MKRPHIEGKLPGVNEGGNPPPIKPGETIEDAAKRLGIKTKTDLEQEEWEKVEHEARRQLANGTDTEIHLIDIEDIEDTPRE
ncbi:MAG: hypothetical protein A2725_01535 [Candidatus Magasanikbacteria bacterium RIFCSPHIGHO2_01_FULL_33_34]|uniref:Uncharacterized protein n=1 Tax=Candidatus Magasanikbacteria bacterium RIFCSPHIGHO2_01_FULL_33_34 TaxID=1798671 RepID=A0A1F6LJG6_9BACT|nr:MAG: hypothetical protein A2725_01535 [Candidatus Magasanikbacteria bacterium RIFCSPHIGHO2_01_FULL_33_34]OGH65495.1 MAG: hypothetical protein A3B83_01290 [Candidatus Magasanikbacteria bacterium RIFCSPHIGHO2_02_FULL_33_17]OGH76205.1 MAG: hypothetical protein A3A89_02110 [Candidatus Magasanikbacteria bacterium RIFCSPLOWO2_01_FULL_33_34]OGH82611.1 MAG: hypothetical protein A3F93_04845 [Candidatus Magasanikbacteria bacterium RIFCSPLOWO2_12_FULL_34_7]